VTAGEVCKHCTVEFKTFFYFVKTLLGDKYVRIHAGDHDVTIKTNEQVSFNVFCNGK